MLIVAFLFSFAAVIGKKAMLHSSPLFFGWFFFLTFNLTIVIGLLVSGRTSRRQILADKSRGMLLGGLLFIHVSCHSLAIVLSPAVYMVAVKRSSILFSVLLSWIILKEGERKTRGLGTLLMFLGVILISMYG